MDVAEKQPDHLARGTGPQSDRTAARARLNGGSRAVRIARAGIEGQCSFDHGAGGVGATLGVASGMLTEGGEGARHVEASLLPELTRWGFPQSVRSQASTVSLEEPTVAVVG